MRRSSRTDALAEIVEKERQMMIEIENGNEDGLVEIDCGHKGRGVQSSKPFCKGDFVCVYKGELVSFKEAVERYTV